MPFTCVEKMSTNETHNYEEIEDLTREDDERGGRIRKRRRCRGKYVMGVLIALAFTMLLSLLIVYVTLLGSWYELLKLILLTAPLSNCSKNIISNNSVRDIDPRHHQYQLVDPPDVTSHHPSDIRRRNRRSFDQMEADAEIIGDPITIPEDIGPDDIVALRIILQIMLKWHDKNDRSLALKSVKVMEKLFRHNRMVLIDGPSKDKNYSIVLNGKKSRKYEQLNEYFFKRTCSCSCIRN